MARLKTPIQKKNLSKFSHDDYKNIFFIKNTRGALTFLNERQIIFHIL